jgi:hypothetical protein
MLFANLQGYRIGFQAELAKDKETAPSQSARDPAEDDEETDDMSRSETHWKRLPPKGKDGDNPGNVAQGEASQKHEPPANQNRSQQVQDAIPQDQPQTTSIYTYKKGYYKVSAGKLRQKQSVGSSSVPLPSAVDSSVTKPASAPAKSKVQPIPFNQYGTNIPQSEAFEEDTERALPKSDCNVEAGERATPIVLSEDDSPPPQPDVDKIQKLTLQSALSWDGRALRAGIMIMKPLLLGLPSSRRKGTAKWRTRLSRRPRPWLLQLLVLFPLRRPLRSLVHVAAIASWARTLNQCPRRPSVPLL